MSALVKKEIRLLLPMWGMAMLVAVVAPWVVYEPANIEGTVVLFFGGAVLLAVASFGREFSLGTFSFLSAQPVDRRRFWWAKFSVLAVAIALMLATFCFSLQLRANAILANPFWQDKFYADTMSAFRLRVRNEPYLGGLLGFVAFAGGLWASLLLRQVASSFWVAFLVPAFIGLGVSWFVPGGGLVLADICWVLYSIACLFWAWRLFQRAEDSAWTGMSATLPIWRFSTALSQPATGARRRSPLAALIAKELQLHHATLLCAVGLLAMHFGVIALRKAGHYPPGGTMQVMLDGFLLIWLAVPWIIGASAVAEERRLGTMEEHLCLPASSRVQFTVKFLVTLLLGALLGAVVPCVVESIGGLLGVSSPIMKVPTGGLSAWVLFLVPAVAIAGVSFYASTLTSNILQALATAVAMIVGIGCVIAAILATLGYSGVFGLILWGPILGTYFVYTLMAAWIVTAICLAYGNFKHLHRGFRIWFRNILSLAAVLLLLATFTTALYHRVWEYLTPLEPAHGPARFTGARPAIIISVDPYKQAVLLPDGRLWREYRVLPIPNRFGMRSQSHPDPLAGNPFVPGSNWVDVVMNWYETVGIQSDGSLWVSETPDKRAEKQFPWGLGYGLVQPLAPPVRYGDETNWQSVVSWGSLRVLLLKTDGTLWGWSGGTNRIKQINEWPGLRAFVPRRLGTESNWAEIFQSGYRPYFRKTDGSVWAPISDTFESGEEINLEPDLTVVRVASLEAGKWSSTTEPSLRTSSKAGVRADGTFRVWAVYQMNRESRHAEWTPTDLQIGNETNWLAVAGWGENQITLKRDGSLWLWTFKVDWRGRDPRHPLQDVQELPQKIPVRLGTHSDWVAIGSTSSGIFSLAADGSLWQWQFANARLHAIGGEPTWLTWLAPSRKPQMIGDIFAASETPPKRKL